jgi:hypothetical protein
MKVGRYEAGRTANNLRSASKQIDELLLSRRVYRKDVDEGDELVVL